MTLFELIEFLEKQPKRKKVAMGFSSPHSYRGYYDEVAFEPTANITVKQMLDAAKSALGSTYTGWKGGEYTMRPHTQCHIAEIGHCGEGIGPVVLNYMMGTYSKDSK